MNMIQIIKDYIEIVNTIIGSLIVGIPSLIALIKLFKKFVKEKNWNVILNILPDLIIKAEEFSHFNGNEKKEWVKSNLRTYCAENNIDFDVDKFEKEITAIVDLTKKVNKREKDLKNEEE